MVVIIIAAILGYMLGFIVGADMSSDSAYTLGTVGLFVGGAIGALALWVMSKN